MKQILTFLTGFLISVLTAFAQDPVKAAPQNYSLQFENELVKVLRVHYPARSKVPVHDHSKAPAAYVYLTDAGPTHFKHPGWNQPVLTRPAVKAGSFRLSPTRFDDETHEVENPGDLPSSFLRIEFKYLPVAKTSIVGRFPREQFPNARSTIKQHFDNENVRVTRYIVPANERIKLTAEKTGPSLLVVVFAGKAREAQSKAEQFEAGQTIWVEAGRDLEMSNAYSKDMEFLKIDLKSVEIRKSSR